MSRLPPPPASYNWKFDTSDEEEEDGEEKKSNSNDSDDEKTKATTVPETENASTMEHNGNVETIPETATAIPTTSNTRNKKRHKRKSNKKSKSKKSSNASQREKPKKQQQLRFGTVRTRTFERCLGSDVVPGDGGWPLGIGKAIHELKTETTVDDYEAAKQERLLKRLEHLNLPKDSIPLETRPWDYKPEKNPLFQLLHEKDRIQLLVGTNDGTEKPKSPERKLRRSSRTTVSSDNIYNDNFPKTQVLHYRHELEQLRISRSQTGCQCRKLHVYIPNNNSGKKAQHRRLKLPKLQAELKKRGALPVAACTREELEVRLLELVQQEPCCGGGGGGEKSGDTTNCPCKQAGIGCQVESCSCWYDSHQNASNSSGATTTKKKKGELSNAEIEARCGNNMYAVDLDKIEAFRRNYLEQLQVCPAISPQG